MLQLLDSDQELYKNFPLVISERWQQEVAETVYEAVNSDTDKSEARKRAKNKQLGHEEGKLIPTDHQHKHGPVRVQSSDCVLSPSPSRLRPGEGLYNARVHAEAGEPVPDSVAAPILLSLPQPCGVEGRGRVTGEFTCRSTPFITFSGPRLSVCLSVYELCLSVCPDSTLKETWLKHFKKQRDGVSVNSRSRSV